MAPMSSWYFGASGAPRWLGPDSALQANLEGFWNLAPLTLPLAESRTDSRPGAQHSELLLLPNFLCTRVWDSFCSWGVIWCVSASERENHRCRWRDPHQETPGPAAGEAKTELGPFPPVHPTPWAPVRELTLRAVGSFPNPRLWVLPNTISQKLTFCLSSQGDIGKEAES